MESSHLGDRIHAGNVNNIEQNKIFSNWTGHIKWFFELKWYTILLIVVFGLFFIFQIESALEIRKRNRKDNNEKQPKKEKEGMQENVEKIKSILRKIDEEDANKNSPQPKNVSFSEKESFVSLKEYDLNEKMHKNGGWTDLKEIFSQFYNWWILPWIYVLFRNVGIQ